MKTYRAVKILGAGVLALASFQSHALQVTALTPQGEVARVRQVVATFDQAAVKFGDPKASAPLIVNCTDAQAAKGTGRWTSEKQWVYDFENDLPPGVNCTVTRQAQFKSPSGSELTGPRGYQFNTGGPFVRSIRPGGGVIDEHQIFMLELNGAATAQSLRENVWCSAEGLGERIAVTLIEGEQRNVLLKAYGRKQDAGKAPQRFAVLQCNRALAPSAHVQLIYGQGVATPSGVANKVERRFPYEVREPFAVTFTCERENAQAGCLPLRAMRLQLNAPVTRALASQIMLRGGAKPQAPSFDEEIANKPDAQVESIKFAPPFPEQTAFTIELPKKFEDVSGRALAEPGSFPLKVSTGAMPPLAKFAASPFGVVERLAEPDGVAHMPLTVRRVEPALAAYAFTPGKVGDLNPKTDAEIIAWMRKLSYYNDNYSITRERAQRDVQGTLPPVIDPNDRDSVQSRMLSLLGGRQNVKTLNLPKAPEGQVRPLEVIGIALTPGYHVLEIASQQLGGTLLDDRYGPKRTMYVRTGVLATNLAVHFKLGRENSVAWVTSLDKGKPVANAAVRVSTCSGEEVAVGITDANGIARLSGISPEAPTCSGDGEWDDYTRAYFVSARAKDAKGVEDLAFTWSDWQRGIEPWRFNLPIGSEPEPNRAAHTIFDRTLLRAGETVSMKHLIRTLTSEGFGLPEAPPDTLVITHSGSGQQFTQPLKWRKTETGGLSAESTFAIAPAAKLGRYEVALRSEGGSEYQSWQDTGSFRVEEFRLPVLEGRIVPANKKPLVAATTLPIDVQINYVAGGGATNLPVRVSAMVRDKSIDFADYSGFSFAAPEKEDASGGSDEYDETATPADEGRIVADKLPLTLDRNGIGTVTIDKIPASPAPRELLLEANYADPNGEVQTLHNTQTLWPAAVIAGIKTEDWMVRGGKLKFQALALDLSGKPQAGVPIEVNAVMHITTTSRKRMVGGFYTYDNKTETKKLGRICRGKSDSRGLLLCEASLNEAGRIELIAAARDEGGRQSLAASTVYVSKQGELWFGGENHDRIDVLPEKKNYEPGELAQFQVRMPFRFATALVAVEREGVLETHVVQLNGKDPTVSLRIKPEWGPNVYVSVLALRGRLREVPWYSFFTWGYQSPREWWNAFWHESSDYVPPTAMVDLSKPAYRLGVAEIHVGTQANQIEIKVDADKSIYPVRGKAQITITGRLPDGKPAAGAEVALAAVDQALLELMPNTSWNLLDAMLTRRSWGVQTATAQMEIVGRRHYGRKAVPAGGDGAGGKSGVRELLDTLLLWDPRVVLDAKGQATVTVPLNDALTKFRVVAVADAGTNLFGTGQTTITAMQDLQIISGLPPLAREDDTFHAQFTLRNTTQKPMKVEITPRAPQITLAPQTLEIAAGQSGEAAWDVTIPAQSGNGGLESLPWEIEARDTQSDARDALKLNQRIVPAVPLTVQQGTLTQLNGPFSLQVAPPADALPGRGGLRLALQPKLADGMPGVRDWFAKYPFTCLEQKVSKAIGLRDPALWRTVAAQLPIHLDKDGLATYFPPRDGETNRGSDTLTAYLLAATHEAAQIDPAFALPSEARAQMERGLSAFVEGRIERKFWSPRQDLDVRKLAAIEALSRYGKAQARMLDSITIAPNQWPTSALIDWAAILKRMQDLPQRQQRLAEAENILKARLSYQGAKLIFSTEQEDYWWWLMTSGDVNTARLLLLVMDDPAWKNDIGKLVGGFINRQHNGAWNTTTANFWGGIALEQFSRKFESTPVAGLTSAALGALKEKVSWSRVERIGSGDPQGVAHQGTFSGAPSSPGKLRNNTLFLPWPQNAKSDTLRVTHQGSGKPWMTLQSVAAVPLKAPFAAGYSIRKTVTPVEQAAPGKYTRGDVLHVTLEVNSSADMTWVVVSDPIPTGATILGSGLGRDSQIATQGERREAYGWTAFEERSFEAFRSYYEYLPKGVVKMEYTVRLNNAGNFSLPPSRIEALYAPEMFGETPNARVTVEQAK